MYQPQKPSGIGKRMPSACKRCRRQKIKCTGTFPCEQCSKRELTCSFDDRSQKILVTKGFISDLERRLSAFEQGEATRPYASIVPSADADATEAGLDSSKNPPAPTVVISDPLQDDENEWIDATEESRQPEVQLAGERSIPETESRSIRTSPGSQLMNPLALGTSMYVPDESGQPIYLGTSSTWSFGRRVLAMTHERISRAPLSSENLLWEGKVYDLGWDGYRSTSSTSRLDPAAPPSPDFAIYLINAVKFHCGQMFHLFDEESFMQHFSQFHDGSTDKSSIPSLWYIHYLLILALGKAFVARRSKGRQPPGGDLFVQAMTLLPDVTFLCIDPVETIEILCCAALYLQSLDFRGSAYRYIGQGLRIALEHGMHTDMQSQYVSGPIVQRCREIWWTVYVLDRQMSSLMGLPMAIRDEDISAGLPSFPSSPQKSKALEMHIKLSRVIAQILNTVYGMEGHLDRKFLISTEAALRSIASVTDQLNASFNITTSGSLTGVSRLSAYLHLLHHQCIVLATRPLMFCFLKMRLEHNEARPTSSPRSNSVRTLIQMCIKSAQQMLKILAELQEQSLLESFLPFDLESTFTSAIILLMAPAIDSTLLEQQDHWPQTTYSILDEMVSRGNLVAGFLKSELQQLRIILEKLPSPPHNRLAAAEPPHYDSGRASTPHRSKVRTENNLAVPQAIDNQPLSKNMLIGDFTWTDGLTTEQLLTVADSIDLNGLEWMPSTLIEFGE